MFRIRLWPTSSERLIESIYKEHLEKLQENKCLLTEEIKKWTETLVDQIGKHCDKALLCVNEKYDQEINRIAEERAKYKEIAYQHHIKDEKHEITQLSENYRCLTFLIDQLGRYQKSIKITISDDMQSTQVVSLDSESNPSEVNEQPEKNTPVVINDHSDDDNEIESFEESVALHNTQNPDTTIENALTVEEDETEVDVTCPVCFLLFPKNMSLEERINHVSLHLQPD